MADQPNTDIAALQTEIKQLRADFAKIAGTMHDIAAQQVQASTDKVSSEVKRQAGRVSREIEERPVAAALTAFGSGILLGLLLNRHRG